MQVDSGSTWDQDFAYLLNKSASENLHITVVDVSLKLAEDKVQNHKNGAIWKKVEKYPNVLIRLSKFPNSG